MKLELRFADPRSALHYAKRQARSAGIVVHVSRQEDGWLVACDTSDDATGPDRPIRHDWLFSEDEADLSRECERYVPVPESPALDMTFDWSVSGDDLDARDYELMWGGPEDDPVT